MEGNYTNLVELFDEVGTQSSQAYKFFETFIRSNRIYRIRKDE